MEDMIDSRILVIDDEPAVRSLIRDFLDELPVEIIEAENGREGLHLLETEPVDILITDILMPETDGIETIIATRKRFPTLPIIAISGGGRSQNMDFLYFSERFGAATTIAKPIRRDKIRKAVSSFLLQVGNRSNPLKEGKALK